MTLVKSLYNTVHERGETVYGLEDAGHLYSKLRKLLV
jgi:hypothetical protein